MENIIKDLVLNNQKLFIYEKGKRKRYILINKDNSTKIFKRFNDLKEYFIPF